IYVALILGESALLKESDSADSPAYDDFNQSGIVYFFAISGLHVAVLAGALWWLLRKIPGLPHGLSESLILAIVWLYAEIGGGTPSARRMAMMLTFYLLARWLGRARSPLAAVVAAGVATLLADPGSLDNSAFELSFAVVLGLVLYAPPLRSAIEARWAPWRDIPPASHAPWQKCVRWLWKYVMDLWALSWTALLCSATLTAEFFGTFSAHALYLTVFSFPLVLIALWMGVIAVATGLAGFAPFTWIAWLANAAGLAAMALMHGLARIIGKWPGFAQLQVTPAWAGSVTALAIVAAMLLAQPKNRAPRWWYYALPVAILAGFAALCVRMA
ncbi:MAG TPA: ComEC/Rec2 family competence protein, partial [Opitutales bacterium]|nr:ComEC/Rec2 family competence protein [Opitutales bacterium]